MPDRIRASALASYCQCPLKIKLQQEYPVWNPNFDLGNLIHRVLAEAPVLILEDKDWRELMYNEIKSLQSCSPEMIDRANAAIQIGWADVKKNIDEGYVITTEVPLERQLPSGITITGTADRIDESRKTLRIIDYKSGFMVPTKQDMLGDMQLLTYAFLCQDRASISQSIEVGLFSLGRGVLQCIEVNPNIEAIIEDIIDVKAQEMLNDDYLKPNPSSLCGYCDYKYKCNFWAELSEHLEIPESIEEKVSMLEKVMSLNKGLSGVGDTLRKEILQYMKENEMTEIHIAGNDCRIVQSVTNKDGKFSASKPYIRIG